MFQEHFKVTPLNKEHLSRKARLTIPLGLSVHISGYKDEANL
jgi:hypothetical protein